MDEVVSESTARTRFDMLLMSVFGASALVLAAVGIYGLMAYSVEQRTQELGVRVAMGAEKADILQLVIGHGMGMTLVGIVFGLAGTLALVQALGDTGLVASREVRERLRARFGLILSHTGLASAGKCDACSLTWLGRRS